jgi:hypothetical protein
MFIKEGLSWVLHAVVFEASAAIGMSQCAGQNTNMISFG